MTHNYQKFNTAFDIILGPGLFKSRAMRTKRFAVAHFVVRSRSCLMNQRTLDGLLTFYYERRSKLPNDVAGFLEVGAVCFWIGFFLLFILITVLAVEQELANKIQLGVVLFINFVLNYHHTWGERRGGRRVFFLRLATFVPVKFGALWLNQALFVTMTEHGVFYLVAYVVAVLAVTVFSFVANRYIIFAPWLTNRVKRNVV